MYHGGRTRGAVAAEVDRFVDCVRGLSEPVCTASDGLEALRISLAMQESAGTGRPVDC
jgi:predicted dehydrogenase